MNKTHRSDRIVWWEFSRRKREEKAHQSILILVSDDAGFISAMKPALECAGFDVRVAATAHQARGLSAFDEPVAILVDSCLRSHPAAEAVEWLRKQPRAGAFAIYLHKRKLPVGDKS